LFRATSGNTEREFFASQISLYSSIYYVDEKYTFEIGGKNKSFEQIKDINNSYVLADGIEVGFKNKLPLWLFGFTY
jgi:hypothetical protein